MSNQRWFYFNLSRIDCENLLLSEGIKGSYLVRESKNNIGNFTLSVRRDSDVVHIKIYNNGDYYDIATGSEFSSLSELISYYANEGNTLLEKNNQIVEPKFPLTLGNNKDPFIAGLTSKRAQELLLNDGRQASFLIRESINNPGDFVLCVLFNKKIIQSIINHLKDGRFKIKGEVVEYDFESLGKLVEYYKSHPITTDDNISFTLAEPVKIGIANQSLYANLEVTDPILMEFEMLQNDVSHMQISRAIGQLSGNRDRNRYKNIVPYDTTRVILKEKILESNNNDYINASYISVQGDSTSFIATQGCLEQTCIDFWRMVWQERSHIIVMITKCIEHGKNKCVTYWPTVKESSLTYNLTHGILSVKLEDTKASQDEAYIVRKFILTLNTLKSSPFGMVDESREVFQYHFMAWPDKSVPNDPKLLLVCLLRVIQQQATFPNPGHIIVHCSAGIGRTGTFIALYYLILQSQNDKKTDVSSLVRDMRKCRPGMVQIDQQYQFIYSCLHFYQQCLKSTHQAT